MTREMYYVGVGASAGGLEALESFFNPMPDDTGLVFIVVQHLSPDFKSLMNELLARYTNMKIHVAEDGMVTEPDHVYLIPPGYNLSIFHGRLLLDRQDERNHLNLPIDIFFRSLALDQEKQAIGVILSGTGSDGTLGVRAIKESGGMIMVQSEASAKFDGMPRSSIATGLVDAILHPEQMAEELMNYVKSPSLQEKWSRNGTNDHQGGLDGLTRIGQIMRSHGGIDFSSYKDTTIIRRIDRRIKINRLHDLDDYIRFLKESGEERDVLQREFLIGVTAFFRDQDAFDVLLEKVIPKLDYKKGLIRVWSAACSTGEEVYSLAMLFHEYIQQHNLDCQVKLFATDVDERALELAGTGYYPDSLIADIDPDLVSRYFIKKEGGYQVTEAIRKMVVFAKHNILRDPPFSKLDLLVCRNLFIYLKSEHQRTILNSFYYSLKPNGYLFLGSSETLGELSEGFAAVDAKWKIYQYKAGYKPDIETGTLLPGYRAEAREVRQERDTDMRGSMKMESLLSEAMASISPPSLIIDRQDEIVHVVNDVSRFIRTQPGRFSNSYHTNMNKEQSLFVSNILRRLKHERQDVTITNVSNFTESDATLTLAGRIFQVRGEDYFLISFMEQKGAAHKGKTVDIDMSEEARERVEELEGELQLAREGLQATIEELETSNEELQSSNEELIASNEELQSTNEELQSVNEELYTVNAEHQMKIDELVKLNNDLNNLIRNTEVGALYLDQSLRIRKLTPVISEVTNILDSDIGRPISHISFIDGYPELIKNIEEVQDTLSPVERQLKLKNDLWYIIRIRPYRTEYNAAEGIIITLVNITGLKDEERKVRLAHDRLTHAMATGDMAWWEFHVPTGHIRYSERLATMMGYEPEEFPNDIQVWMRLIHPDDRAMVRSKMKAFQEGDDPILDRIYRIQRKDQSYAWFHDKADVIEWKKDGTPARIAGTAIDISRYKYLESELREMQEKDRSSQKGDGI
ncbi:chemotaxis protein CheB [Salisediminibacterium selenitireducens]|uniref:protein-glutamate O-methyltransferase n=1 Tax=Bacillus selenitireducens (strain ATCC 700615 / DSM 15326 / MLS10) TaxID=439292 RepID=D6XXA7_BACIE|nr:chemotaxis protein CheB [Salisediminibacterium selenitireducens]ADH97964.1 MCP methyltransferase/methylesterase, CheR/CheB with PAS/PAC sensor [[Bacillus] selenitireducens MLS10]